MRASKCYVANGILNEEELATAIKVEHKKPMKYSTIKEIVVLLK